MITMSNVTAESPTDYYARERGESLTDYYSRNLDESHDCWHGELARRMGYEGAIKLEQYAALKDELAKPKQEGGDFGRKEIVFKDITFSAPKSVSNLLAFDETRPLVIKAMLNANEYAMNYIEDNLLQCKVRNGTNNRFVKTDNMACASWLHELSRENDLDLHIHNAIANVTYCDGKLRAIDWNKIVRNKAKIDLLYTQRLAYELQQLGFELEDERINEKLRGTFRIAGTTKEGDMEQSKSRQRILAEAEKIGDTSYEARQEIELKTRKAKRLPENMQEHYAKKREELKDEGYKKAIENISKARTGTEAKYYEYRALDSKDIEAIGKGTLNLETGRTVADTAVPASERRRSFEESTIEHGLQDLFQRGFHQERGMSSGFLQGHKYSHLAKQYDASSPGSVRLPRSEAKRREYIRQRLNLIDTVTAETIKELAGKDFCFALPQLVDGIQRAHARYNISEAEAKLAIERAKLINLGKILRYDGSYSKDIFLTTEKNILLEIDSVGKALAGNGQLAWGMGSLEIENKIKAYSERQIKKGGFAPSNKQKEAIRLLLANKDRVVALQGIAGTGKTTTAKAVKAIAEKSGIKIYGASFTGKAANGLKNESGIESTTLHSLLNQIESGEFSHAINGSGSIKVKSFSSENANRQYDKDFNNGKIDLNREHDFSAVEKLTKPTVLLVDEAGLTNDHLMHELLRASDALGDNLKVVLQGDYKQLQSIGQGEAFKMLIDHGISTVRIEDMEDIHRQNDRAFQGAVYQASNGEPALAWDFLKSRGWTHQQKNNDRRCNEIKDRICETKLENYVERGKDGEGKLALLMLASTNAERKHYNEIIRSEYVKRGELAEGTVFKCNIAQDEDGKDVIEERKFAANDRIIFLKNDLKGIGVLNGEMGTVKKINGDNLTVITDAGKSIDFNVKEYNNLDHSYCVTTYKSQGMTVGNVYIDATKASGGLQEFYVDISRAKEKAEIWSRNLAKTERDTAKFLSKKTVESFSAVYAAAKTSGLENLKRWERPAVELTEEPAKISKELSAAIQKLETINHTRQNEQKEFTAPAASLSELGHREDLLKGLDESLKAPKQKAREDIKVHTENRSIKLTGEEKIAEIRTWKALPEEDRNLITKKMTSITITPEDFAQAAESIGMKRMQEINNAWSQGRNIELSEAEKSAIANLTKAARKQAEPYYYYRDESTGHLTAIDRKSFKVDIREEIESKGSFEIYAAEGQKELRERQREEKEHNLTDEERYERKAQKQEAERERGTAQEKNQKTSLLFLNRDSSQTGRIEALLNESIANAKAAYLPAELQPEERQVMQEIRNTLQSEATAKVKDLHKDFAPGRTWENRFGDIHVLEHENGSNVELKVSLKDPIWLQSYERQTAAAIGTERWREIKNSLAAGQTPKLTEDESRTLKNISKLKAYYQEKNKIRQELEAFDKSISKESLKEREFTPLLQEKRKEREYIVGR